jgi:hypothetical protein
MRRSRVAQFSGIALLIAAFTATACSESTGGSGIEWAEQARVEATATPHPPPTTSPIPIPTVNYRELGYPAKASKLALEDFKLMEKAERREKFPGSVTPLWETLVNVQVNQYKNLLDDWNSLVPPTSFSESHGHYEIALEYANIAARAELDWVSVGFSEEERAEIKSTWRNAMATATFHRDQAITTEVPTPIPTTPTPIPTSTPRPTAVPRTPFGDGMHIVGGTVGPGTYQAAGSTFGCYWARLNGFSGELDDIIANNFATGQQLVTIKSSDKGFESEGCGTWFPVGN